MMALSLGLGDFCTVCISRNEIHLQIFIPGAVSLAFYCWNNAWFLLNKIYFEKFESENLVVR